MISLKDLCWVKVDLANIQILTGFDFNLQKQLLVHYQLRRGNCEMLYVATTLFLLTHI